MTKTSLIAAGAALLATTAGAAELSYQRLEWHDNTLRGDGLDYATRLASIRVEIDGPLGFGGVAVTQGRLDRDPLFPVLSRTELAFTLGVHLTPAIDVYARAGQLDNLGLASDFTGFGVQAAHGPWTLGLRHTEFTDFETSVTEGIAEVAFSTGYNARLLHATGEDTEESALIVGHAGARHDAALALWREGIVDLAGLDLSYDLTDRWQLLATASRIWSEGEPPFTYINAGVSYAIHEGLRLEARYGQVRPHGQPTIDDMSLVLVTEFGAQRDRFDAIRTDLDQYLPPFRRTADF